MSDVLAPQPLSAEQVADLVERARAGSREVSSTAGRTNVTARYRCWTLRADPTALDHLPAEYAAARQMATASAVHQGGVPRHTCRYCGHFWKPVVASQLDGHTQCQVGLEFKLEVSRLLASPHITQKAVAARLGVTVSVVRAWWLRAGGQP